MKKRKSKTKKKKIRKLEFALPKSALRKEGVKEEEVKKILFDYLKGRGKRGYGPILSQLIFEEYISGESTSSIAKKYGVSRRTVKDLLYDKKRGSLIGHPLPSERGKHTSRAKRLRIQRMSKEERREYSRMMSDAAKVLWEGMTPKQKEDFIRKKSKTIRENIESLTEEERRETYGRKWGITRLEYMSSLGKNWFRSLPKEKQDELRAIFAAMKTFKLKKGEAHILMENFWKGMAPELRRWKKKAS